MKRFLGILIAAAGLLLVLQVIYWFVLRSIIDSKQSEAWQQMGTFGDSFGAVSAFSSTLGLFAVAYALWQDISARRSERQLQLSDRSPYLAPVLREEFGVTPSAPTKAEFRLAMSIPLEVQNLSTCPAVDVVARARLSWSMPAGVQGLGPVGANKELTVPLAAGGEAPMGLELRADDRVADQLGDFFGSGGVAYLDIQAECHSIERVKLVSSVQYKVEMVRAERDEFRRIVDQDRSDLHEQLNLGGSDSKRLVVEVVQGSWRRELIA